MKKGIHYVKHRARHKVGGFTDPTHNTWRVYRDGTWIDPNWGVFHYDTKADAQIAVGEMLDREMQQRLGLRRTPPNPDAIIASAATSREPIVLAIDREWHDNDRLRELEAGLVACREREASLHRRLVTALQGNEKAFAEGFDKGWMAGADLSLPIYHTSATLALADWRNRSTNHDGGV